LTTDLAAGGWPGLAAGPRLGGAVAELRAGGAVASPPPLPPPCDDDEAGAGAAVTGPGVDANPMTLASTMTTTAVTTTQA
jgi:hypothetical protein